MSVSNLGNMADEPVASRQGRKRKRRLQAGLEAIGLPLLSGVIMVGLWEIVVRRYHIPYYLVPAPSSIVEEIGKNWPLLFKELGATIFAAAIGFAIALGLSIPLAAAIVSSRVVERMLYPWLIVSAAVPKVVIAPLFLVWFGFGLKSEVLFVVTFTFFPLIVNTVIGLKSADPDLLQLVQSMGASRLQLLLKIRIPTALPNIFAGIKIAITLAPVGAVVGEFVASNSGIGHLLVITVGNMETPLAFAAVAIFSVFGVLLWYAAERVESVMLPWHASQRRVAAPPV
ncbi:MAG: ABC transporter permease [Hyphomicrobiales bacterium]